MTEPKRSILSNKYFFFGKRSSLKSTSGYYDESKAGEGLFRAGVATLVMRLPT